MPPSGLLQTHILGLFLQSVFYGLFCLSTAACIRSVLNFRKRGQNRSSVKWLMLIITGLLWVVGTLDVVLEVVRHIDAFITSPEGPLAIFTDLASWINICKAADSGVQTLIGDALLIYRCWVIYNQSWAVISLPLLLWMGGAICILLAAIFQSKIDLSSTLETSALAPIFNAFWASTIALNIMTTVLIVYRIWRARQLTKKISQNSTLTVSSPDNHPSYLKNTMRIMIDSGVLNTSMSIITLMTYVSRSDLLYITSNIVSTIQ
ncbi:hypothetical protein GYMLUDRAFT_156949 [Collybiopsis luxurians FD-317 M1]|nr:hypothetical protein GYMLUDRAFT_156949 [Collybiopsis luxurians FD-317 M1]